jgi:hypothetical protein
VLEVEQVELMLLARKLGLVVLRVTLRQHTSASACVTDAYVSSLKNRALIEG